jgi:hypothetical protein
MQVAPAERAAGWVEYGRENVYDPHRQEERLPAEVASQGFDEKGERGFLERHAKPRRRVGR